MRTLLAALTVGLSAFLVGCNTDKTNGTGKGGKTVEYDVYPTEVIVLKPGDEKQAKLSRKGKDLKDTDVKVTSSDPNVTVSGGSFKGTDKESTITIKATPEAAAKEHTITVKAGDVTKTFKVRVEGAGKGDDKTDDKAKSDDKNKKDGK